MINATSAAAPRVTLRFVAEGNESVEALRDGSIDLDIGAGDVTAPDLRTAVLYHERLVGIVRTDHPLGRRHGPTLAELCHHPHVSASRRGRARGPLDDVLEAAGLRRHVAAVVPTFAAAALMVASGRYVGLIPERLAEEHGPALSLRRFPIPARSPNPTSACPGTPASTPTRPNAGCATPSDRQCTDTDQVRPGPSVP